MEVKTIEIARTHFFVFGLVQGNFTMHSLWFAFVVKCESQFEFTDLPSIYIVMQLFIGGLSLIFYVKTGNFFAYFSSFLSNYSQDFYVVPFIGHLFVTSRMSGHFFVAIQIHFHTMTYIRVYFWSNLNVNLLWCSFICCGFSWFIPKIICVLEGETYSNLSIYVFF